MNILSCLRNTTIVVWVIFVCAISFTPSVQAIDISGQAKIIDGDTISIGSQVIRLYGVDAPENGQNCYRKNDKKYNCGQNSENFLKSLTKNKVSCTGKEFDGYERLIAVCHSSDVEINREMVRSGNALAFRRYSEDYVQDERYAAASSAGMWQGRFTNPWDFRAEKWNSASKQAPSDKCPIKGNINNKGEKIYHTPWSRSYSRTRINTRKSERWFCSETEALAAGWRAPYR